MRIITVLLVTAAIFVGHAAAAKKDVNNRPRSPAWKRGSGLPAEARLQLLARDLEEFENLYARDAEPDAYPYADADADVWAEYLDG